MNGNIYNAGVLKFYFVIREYSTISTSFANVHPVHSPVSEREGEYQNGIYYTLLDNFRNGHTH